jgi:putative transposase
MKGKRFTEEQITYALHQAEGGMPVVDVCRQLGVSEASVYLWKKEVRQARHDGDPGDASAAR